MRTSESQVKHTLRMESLQDNEFGDVSTNSVCSEQFVLDFESRNVMVEPRSKQTLSMEEALVSLSMFVRQKVERLLLRQSNSIRGASSLKDAFPVQALSQCAPGVLEEVQMFIKCLKSIDIKESQDFVPFRVAMSSTQNHAFVLSQSGVCAAVQIVLEKSHDIYVSSRQLLEWLELPSRTAKLVLQQRCLAMKLIGHFNQTRDIAKLQFVDAAGHDLSAVVKETEPLLLWETSGNSEVGVSSLTERMLYKGTLHVGCTVSHFYLNSLLREVFPSSCVNGVLDRFCVLQRDVVQWCTDMLKKLYASDVTLSPEDELLVCGASRPHLACVFATLWVQKFCLAELKEANRIDSLSLETMQQFAVVLRRYLIDLYQHVTLCSDARCNTLLLLKLFSALKRVVVEDCRTTCGEKSASSSYPGLSSSPECNIVCTSCDSVSSASDCVHVAVPVKDILKEALKPSSTDKMLAAVGSFCHIATPDKKAVLKVFDDESGCDDAVRLNSENVEQIISLESLTARECEEYVRPREEGKLVKSLMASNGGKRMRDVEIVLV